MAKQCVPRQESNDARVRPTQKVAKYREKAEWEEEN